MEEDDIVEGKKELLVLISSRLMAMLIELEKELGECPFDEIVEELLILGLAFEKVQFDAGYVRLSSVKSLMIDFYSKLEREVVDEVEFLKADGFGKLAEEGV